MTAQTTRLIRPADHDVPVVWADGAKPATFPHTEGVLFFAKGEVAWVRWAGHAPTPCARKALRVVR